MQIAREAKEHVVRAQPLEYSVQAHMPTGKVLLDYVQRKSGLVIQIERIPLSTDTGDTMRGALIRRRKSAMIRYDSSLNQCWRRFVVTKELFHLLIDTDKDMTLHLEEQMIAVSRRSLGGENTRISSEILATHGATEYLMPFEYRDPRFHKSPPVTDAERMKIARRWRIPFVQVEKFYTGHHQHSCDLNRICQKAS